MIFFRKKPLPNDFEIALQYAKACEFGMRHGDAETDFAFADGGVRVVVFEFGDFMPFLLGQTTQDWIKVRFRLNDEQTQKIMGLLRSRVQEYLRNAERRIKNSNKGRRMPGTNLTWLSDQLQSEFLR
jgi:hypothetical protein